MSEPNFILDPPSQEKKQRAPTPLPGCIETPPDPLQLGVEGERHRKAKIRSPGQQSRLLRT